MSCYIENGLTLGCRDAAIGGIKSVYILGGSGNTISSITTDADDQITAISGSGVMYKFELVKGSSSFEETISVNATSNSVVYQPSLTLNLTKFDNALRKVWYELTKQPEFFVVVEDNNGRYWFPGEVNGLTITDGSVFTGAAFTDANGSTMTATGGEPAATREVEVATTIDAVFSGITFDAV
jgi:hypothetical protein